MSPGGRQLATPLPEERAVGRVKAGPPPKMRSSPERVLDPTKQVRCLQSRVFTDGESFLPFGLHWAQEDYEERLKKTSETFHNRCVSLSVSMRVYRCKGSMEYTKAEGEAQAFIVKIGREVFMVTVKHNFCSEVNKEGEFEQCVSVDPFFPGVSYCVGIPFSKCEDGILGYDADSSQDKFKPTEWKYGNEILMIPFGEESVNAVKRVNVHSEFFEAISTTFEVKENMEVGIMAHSNTGLLAQSMQNQLQDAGEDFKAEKGDIFITVGKITRVGDEHIEYNANTVHGFSGAPVFLLSAGTDDAKHHMKVIAVHAGNSKETGNNFGFLVSPQIHATAAWGAADETT